jgi:plastocyanin
MVLRRGRVAVLASAGLVAGLLVVPALSDAARAAPQTIAIGVDHAPPAGHNFEYVDFFPRSGVNIHTGDVIDFGWATTPDGLHTATLLKTGESPGHAWAAHLLATPDAEDGANQLQFNPGIAAPTFPPVGSGAPGACGSAAKPCVYNGSADLNSGANPTTGTAHFFVKVNVPAGTKVNVVCLIHPGMAGSFNVVSAGAAASTPSAVTAAAAAQASSDTTGAFGAESAVGAPSVQTNADGTHTVTLVAGTATPFVEVAEMLPAAATVTAGDTVRWITKTIKDPHTISFPLGSDPSTEPIPNYCEGSPDVLQTAPPAGPPCGDPTKFEVHFNPAPVGPTAIATPVTVASSGLISNPPAPFPTQYSFTFPNAGTFTYQCRIHDHMIGTLTVQAGAATPITTTPRLTG